MTLGSIRNARRHEAAEILRLQRLAYESEARLYNNWQIPPLTQTEAELAADIDTQTVLVLEVDGAIAGSVRAGLKEGVCDIGRLIVHPDHQRRGYGRALMWAIEQAFPSARSFRVYTGDKSQANIAHYTSHGYAVSGSRPLSDSVTVVIMEKAAAAG